MYDKLTNIQLKRSLKSFKDHALQLVQELTVQVNRLLGFIVSRIMHSRCWLNYQLVGPVKAPSVKNGNGDTVKQ